MRIPRLWFVLLPLLLAVAGCTEDPVFDFDGAPDYWQPGPYDAATYPALGWDCDDRDPLLRPGSGC